MRNNQVQRYGTAAIPAGVVAGGKYIWDTRHNPEGIYRTSERAARSVIRNAKRAANYAKDELLGKPLKRKYRGKAAAAAGGLYKAGIRQYGRKADFKKKRRMRVSRTFKKKVKIATKNYFPSGFYQEITVGKFTFNADQQVVYNCPATPSATRTGILSDGIPGCHFTPTQILDAASILWNNKGASQTKTITDTNNFNPETAKIEIRNCFSMIKIKNNTQRLANVLMVIGDPKKTTFTVQSFLDTWINQLLSDSTTGPQGMNVLDNSVNTLYNSPGLNPGMRSQYKISRTKIKLEPGQEFNFKMQGPQNETLNMKTLYRGGTYQNQSSKYTRQLFIIAYPDMLGCADSSVHRTQSASTTTPGILVECSQYYNLTMPDTTGWDNTAGLLPAVVPLEMRRSAYAIRNYTIGDVTGPVGINESNTAQTLAPPYG